MKNSVNNLVNDLKRFIKNKNYPEESLYEIMSVFDFNFRDIYVDKEKHYGFYENDLIQLYILDFDQIISDNKLMYLENIFEIKFPDYSSNKSKDKMHYEKYIEV